MKQALSDTLFSDVPHPSNHSIKQISWPLLLAILVIHTILAIYINFVLFHSSVSPIIRLDRASKGLISGTWTANLLLLLLVVGGCIIAIGKLRLQDIGLVWRHLPAAILITLGSWLAMQIVELLALLDQHTTRTISVWSSDGPQQVIGNLLGQYAGNALYEEVLFRGFLIAQLYLLLQRRWPQHSQRNEIVALLLSQAIFALSHIPNRLANDTSLLTILDPFGGGLLFAAIYLRTGNLFVSIGMHALGNYPALLLETTAESWMIRQVILFVLIMPWGWHKRFQNATTSNQELPE